MLLGADQVMAIYSRFWKARDTVLDETQKIKLKTIEYLLFEPGGQDITRAAELLSEIGF